MRGRGWAAALVEAHGWRAGQSAAVGARKGRRQDARVDAGFEGFSGASFEPIPLPTATNPVGATTGDKGGAPVNLGRGYASILVHFSFTCNLGSLAALLIGDRRRVFLA